MYDESTLFPVRGASTTSNTRRVVGSQVVSAIVGGVARGTTLTAPVTFYLRLKNIEHDEVVSNRSCVFWDFTAASEYIITVTVAI